MPLSDTACRSAKPGSTTRKLSDGGGLQLHVSPAGGRSWKLAFRRGGKQTKVTIGDYPGVSLKEARAERDRLKAILKEGGDPLQDRALRKAQAVADRAATFETVAKELLDRKRAKAAANTIAKLEWLHGLANEAFGTLPISGINAPIIAQLLVKIEKTGRLETARRLRAVISEVFRYSVATGRCDADPAHALRGGTATPQVKNRAAITNPTAFGALLRAIDGYDGFAARMAFQLLALTAVRPGEVRAAKWGEFDLNAALWTIPSSRMKMRRDHLVPLAPQVLRLLAELKPLTGGGSDALLFPGNGWSGGVGRKVGRKPISDATLNAALRRLGFDGETHVSHGFRASFSTMANESGKWSADVIEAALAHVTPGVRGIYARGDFLDERQRLMAWWADRCDTMRAGAEIVSLKVRA